jgi:hypothetical protein
MKTKQLLSTLLLMGSLLLAGCNGGRVGQLRSEIQSVKLEGSGPVRVEINFGAGDLKLTGGAKELMEADFTYNVARIKPEVQYARGTLAVSQPSSEGWPNMSGITGFRNVWDLRLYEGVPMDLNVDIGAGNSSLQVASLSLTGLDVKLGAGTSTVDLNGAWRQDMDVSIDAGASDLTVSLPSDVGVRIEVDRGPTILDAPDMRQDGNVFTNDAYGHSDVTMRIRITSGIGIIHLLTADIA